MTDEYSERVEFLQPQTNVMFTRRVPTKCQTISPGVCTCSVGGHASAVDITQQSGLSDAVCLAGCEQENSKSHGIILTKFSGSTLDRQWDVDEVI